MPTKANALPDGSLCSSLSDFQVSIRFINTSVKLILLLAREKVARTRGDQSESRQQIFTVGEAVRSTCGNSHKEEEKEKEDRFLQD